MFSPCRGFHRCERTALFAIGFGTLALLNSDFFDCFAEPDCLPRPLRIILPGYFAG